MSTIFIVLSCISTTILYLFYTSNLNATLATIKQNEKTQINIQAQMIDNKMRSVGSDLLYLSELSSFKSYMKNKNTFTKKQLSNDLLAFSARQKIYDQIRFLDLSGDEIIRINFDKKKPYNVPLNKLQNKKNRYYFKNTLKTQTGHVFISNFDLNIENKKIEKPIKPMIRFGTVIENKSGQKEGVFILNYFGNDLLNNLREDNLKNEKEYTLLLNRYGFFLKGITPKDEWGFMYNNDNTFKKFFPTANNFVFSKNDWQILTKNGLFTFNTVYPLEVVQSHLFSEKERHKTQSKKIYGKLISFVPQQTINILNQKSLNQFQLLSFVFALFWIFVTLTVVLLIKRRHEIIQTMQELSTRKTSFVSNVAHEFKNPLHVIVSSMSIFLNGTAGSFSEEQKELLYSSKNTADRLNRLVMNLLDISKIESGVIKLEKQEVNIKDLVEEITKTYEMQLEQKKLSLNKNFDTQINTIFADRDKLTEIIINLLNNAINYTPDNGTITINVKKVNSNMQFEVCDSGKGIPKEYLEKIFDKFERIKGEKAEGTGLGLPIAQDLVLMHKGKIWIESEPNNGSKFIFTIPLK
jgi:signal transduction histidine kinase